MNPNRPSRRGLIGAVAGTGASIGLISLLQGCGGSGSSSPTLSSGRPYLTDYLNFCLNLEYLEAEFYLRATSGQGLPASLTGTSPGTVTGGAQAPFVTPAIQAAATQFAQQEQEHVSYLRGQLFSGAVSRPTINFTAGFNFVATASGIGSSLNPFADENSFLLGSFFLEDLVATAYFGILAKDASVFGGLLGVESYHGGIVRNTIFTEGGTLLSEANSISAFRSAYGQGGEQPLSGAVGDIAPGSSLATAIGREPEQVLAILYGSKLGTPGAFFPNRFNGYIA